MKVSYSLTLPVLAFIQSTLALECYVSERTSTTPALTKVSPPSTPSSPNTLICASFTIKCTEAYNYSCAPLEIQQNVVKWTYTYYTESVCKSLKNDVDLGNICCCGYDGCNAVGKYVNGCSNVATRDLVVDKAGDEAKNNLPLEDILKRSSGISVSVCLSIILSSILACLLKALL